MLSRQNNLLSPERNPPKPIHPAANFSTTAGTTSTGDRLQLLALPGTLLTGLAREGTMLYTMDSAKTLRAVDISGLDMVARGFVTMPNGAGKLFVGNHIAYVPVIKTDGHGGFNTADVSNPDNLFVIGDSVLSNGGPGTAIAVNGSGVGTLMR